VGTGFHPELTGRENIFLNGAILGMRKHEIARKLDEIIAFSGVERYIDTPVKRYSSGMYVRLAFAVAAHLESEILIVDEVLAVGDADFQKKCLGKMNDVSKGEGRTVLFVSHNMAAVKSLCTRGIVLENGTLKFDGGVDDALTIYSDIGKSSDYKVVFDASTKRNGNGKMQFQSIEISNQNDKLTQDFSIGDDLKIKLKIKNFSKELKSEMSIQILSAEEMPIFHIMPRDSGFELNHELEEENYELILNDIRLFPGTYSISIVSSNTTGHEIFDEINNVLQFEIIDGGNYTSRKLPRSVGMFFLNPIWNKK
jgi:lipopolysaccharide transport system ATP-binding protein